MNKRKCVVTVVAPLSICQNLSFLPSGVEFVKFLLVKLPPTWCYLQISLWGWWKNDFLQTILARKQWITLEIEKGTRVWRDQNSFYGHQRYLIGVSCKSDERLFHKFNLTKKARMSQGNSGWFDNNRKLTIWKNSAYDMWDCGWVNKLRNFSKSP